MRVPTGRLTGQKCLCVLLQTQKISTFFLVSRLVVMGLPAIEKVYVLKVNAPFSRLKSLDVSGSFLCFVAHRIHVLRHRWPSTRSQKGLSLENSEKSLQRGSRTLSAPGSGNLENDNFSTLFSGFRLVFNSFSTFFEFFRPRGLSWPREPLFRLFGSFLG